jgi:hypothetical protein
MLRLNFWATKNPASSAGLFRPSLEPLVARHPERKCSKLDFFLSGIRNQLHLWVSRQVRFVSSLSPNQGSTNIKQVYWKKSFRQACSKNLLKLIL